MSQYFENDRGNSFPYVFVFYSFKNHAYNSNNVVNQVWQLLIILIN